MGVGPGLLSLHLRSFFFFFLGGGWVYHRNKTNEKYCRGEVVGSIWEVPKIGGGYLILGSL